MLAVLGPVRRVSVRRHASGGGSSGPSIPSVERRPVRNDCYGAGSIQRMAECAEDGCSTPAAVRLHVPWAENREVCTAHARSLVQQDGVVAEPLDSAADDWR